MQTFTRAGTTARLLALLFSLSVFFCAPQLQAADEDAEGDFWEKYDDIADWVSLRLKLTPEQEKSVLPILSGNFERRLELLKKYGFSPSKRPKLSRVQKEEIDARMIGIGADTRARLVPILDEKQLAELKKIQEEFHLDFRRRLFKDKL
ncbi:hypothetical protein SAMN04487965_1430 [Microbulbifer donghaiensis]|uniref:LTXXQ motif family protein n=1 Tax=Microbulbifer donghaiensis TaxID=494016 RepID=A0A1M4Z403_9GAMM|nr:hypothetical protein [Microbulbifer donghaiensis]SHF12750.1 hypothetical protein SAMN04487965_1430 [Microbulbifer donghaiensis]